jgi:hypothetical protein
MCHLKTVDILPHAATFCRQETQERVRNARVENLPEVRPPRMSMPAPDRRMGGWTGVGYDDIAVGQAFAPQPLPVTADDVAQFYRCLGEVRPSPEIGTRVPSFLLNELRAMKNQMRFPPGVLHAQEEIEMFSAARLGEPLAVSITIANKYIRNDKRFIVINQHVHCPVDQRSIMNVRHILYWPC